MRIELDDDRIISVKDAQKNMFEKLGIFDKESTDNSVEQVDSSDKATIRFVLRVFFFFC